MKLGSLLAAAAAFALSAVAEAAPNPDQVAYTYLNGKTWELVITDENGQHSSVVYRSTNPLRFDLGPRSSNLVAISDGGPIKLLTLGRSSTGAYTAVGSPVTIATGLTQWRRVDFSPDGSKVAFPGPGQTLLVYDVASQTTTQWGAFTWVWDLAWYLDGSGIAVVAPSTSNGSPDEVLKITGPGATPMLMFQAIQVDRVDAARTSSSLIVTYRSDSSGNRVGVLTGTTLNPARVDNSTSTADNGTLNCDDTKLAYMAPNQSRQSVWYLQELSSGLRSLYSKTTNLKWLQYFPTCS